MAYLIYLLRKIYQVPSRKNKSRFSMSQRIKSFKYAFRGIGIALKGQHNFRIHLIAAILVIAGAFLLDISNNEWLTIIFAIGLVFSAEIINTAIEELVDFVSPDVHPDAARIKDLAAGAVLVCAFTAAIIGLIIFLPKIIDLL